MEKQEARRILRRIMFDGFSLDNDLENCMKNDNPSNVSSLINDIIDERNGKRKKRK